MRSRTVIAGVLALIVGAAHGEPQLAPAPVVSSLVGEWTRVGKPRATVRYRADGTWSMHVVDDRGRTADLSGTYTFRSNLLERTTLKTLLSRKRPFLKTERAFRQFELKWTTKNRLVLTDRGGPRERQGAPDTWVRRAAGSSE